MAEIFKIANSTNGVNADCIASMQPADYWKCNFAEEAYVARSAQTQTKTCRHCGSARIVDVV